MYELKKGTNDCLFIYKDKTPIAGFHDENYAKLFYDFLNKKDQKCENCDIGKPVICEKCYEIESNFRESYQYGKFDEQDVERYNWLCKVRRHLENNFDDKNEGN